MKTRMLLLLSILGVGLLATAPCFPGGPPPPPLTIDTDEDDLCNDCEEQIFGTSTTRMDTDEDGIPDGDEDHDEDGLTNLEELNNIILLRKAISTGDEKGVLEFLDYSPYITTIDEINWSALFIAADGGHAEIVQILLEAGARTNYTITYAMNVAAYAGHTEVAAILLEAGAEVNARDGNGFTPLMEAARKDHLEVVKLLLREGAEVDVKDNHGYTALIHAVDFRFWVDSKKRQEIAKSAQLVVRELIAAGADVDTRNNFGETALLKVMSRLITNDMEMALTSIVDTLVTAGADVNARNRYGVTALMLASWNGQTDCVRNLLEVDAEVNALDDNGKSALMRARENGHSEIIDLLIEAGAEK